MKRELIPESQQGLALVAWIGGCGHCVFEPAPMHLCAQFKCKSSERDLSDSVGFTFADATPLDEEEMP